MAITLDGSNGILSPDFEPSSSTTPTNGLFLPAANALGFATNSTERLRLDASGNLGIGTTNPTYKLTVAGYSNVASSNKLAIGGTADYQALFYMESANETFTIENTSDYAASAIILKTNNSERARIDSSGNLLIGTTTAFGRLASQQTTSAVNFRAECNVTSYTSTNIWSTFTSSGNNNTTAIHFAAYTGTNVCVIYGNGNIQNTNNSYGALSDIKLKENIVDATPKLEDLCKVKIRNFSLKGEQNHKQIGVVAQELEEIFPGLVEEVADRDEKGNILGTSTKSVKYSVFTPMLIKAIQELTARLETLENK